MSGAAGVESPVGRVATEADEGLRAGVRESALAIARKYPRSYWLEQARQGRHVEEMWHALADSGLLGLGVPESMGGSGGGLTELVLLTHVLSSEGVPTLHLVLTGLVHSSLVRNGTPEQVARYVAPSMSATARLCLGVTEPDAGTNTFAIKSVASKHERGWKISGQKIFISGADEADHMFTIVRTPDTPAPSGRPGLSVFMVPLGGRGVECHPLSIEIIQPDSQFSVFLDEVVVGPETLVGPEGGGAKAMFDALDSERLLVAAMAIGLGEYALGKAVAYARERAPFGKPIGSYQGVQHRLARAKAHLEAAYRVTVEAAEGYDQGASVKDLCGMAKLLASEAGTEACDAAIQVHGGYAFDTDYDVSTIWPLVRLFSIAPVNNEMILNSIGQHVLGLPKSY